MLENYVEVKDRLPLWLADYPEGRVVTAIVSIDMDATPAHVVMRCELYRDAEVATPHAVGHAYEREIGKNGRGVNLTSFLENCETSAIGRALANAGYQGNGKRPSREEMSKVTRTEEEIDRLAAEVQAFLADQSRPTPENVMVAAQSAIKDRDFVRLTRALKYFRSSTQ